jgi:hypothetical protein
MATCPLSGPRPSCTKNKSAHVGDHETFLRHGQPPTTSMARVRVCASAGHQNFALSMAFFVITNTYGHLSSHGRRNFYNNHLEETE